MGPKLCLSLVMTDMLQYHDQRLLCLMIWAVGFSGCWLEICSNSSIKVMTGWLFVSFIYIWHNKLLLQWVARCCACHQLEPNHHYLRSLTIMLLKIVLLSMSNCEGGGLMHANTGLQLIFSLTPTFGWLYTRLR